MTKKIFHSIVLVAVAVLLANLLIVMGCLYEYYQKMQEKQLQDELQLASYAVEAEGMPYLERLRSNRLPLIGEYRFTWVSQNGTVLFDTSMEADLMENHLDRAEVQEALLKGESSSIRYSNTLTEQTLYAAKALEDGTVLRVSVSQATVFTLVMGMLQPICVVTLIAVLLSALLARRMARKIVSPLNSLDLDHPLENDAYEELAPLLGRIHQQHRQIDEQLHSLQKKEEEFEQVTGSMKEGLVLLDNAGCILSINAAAQKIFQTDSSCGGQAFLSVERSPEIDAAIQAARERGHGEAHGERGGREYQFDTSRIESDGGTAGTVLLAFDVTEQLAAERSRREFTTNVSHELKTPLQSITGSAELLENGLVEEKDVPRFISLIHTEAARLVTLVEDIIHLSQLDEGAAPTRENVDLYETAKSVASALQGSAEKKRVRLTVSGESAHIEGVPAFLYELLYNLCDNAIKYNVEEGEAVVTVGRSADGVTVTVRDTGIGIPPEYQSRVFERFFRVDKSRSKASGGTGLGLSIVKHIAQYHHASIALDSTPGEGTTIWVVFPAG